MIRRGPSVKSQRTTKPLRGLALTDNVVAIPGCKAASSDSIMDALRSALSMATNAEFEHVTIVMKMGEKASVIVRSSE